MWFSSRGTASVAAYDPSKVVFKYSSPLCVEERGAGSARSCTCRMSMLGIDVDDLLVNMSRGQGPGMSRPWRQIISKSCCEDEVSDRSRKSVCAMMMPACLAILHYLEKHHCNR